MTKEVLISIEGLQLGSEEEPIITKVTGTYHFTNGRHYIQYEEKSEEEAITKNSIKITPAKVTLSKKGITNSVMEFIMDEVTQAIYNTPYGNLIFHIKTSFMLLEESKDLIEMKMGYSLSSDASKLSDNRISIKISSII